MLSLYNTNNLMGNEISNNQEANNDIDNQNEIDKYLENLIKYSNNSLQNICKYDENNCAHVISSTKYSLNKILDKLSKKTKQTLIKYHDPQLSELTLRNYYQRKINLIVKLKHIIYTIINNQFSNKNFPYDDNHKIKKLNDLTRIYNLLLRETCENKKNTNKKFIIIHEKPVNLKNLKYYNCKVNKIINNLYHI